jgi:O-methyltransferase domain/Dimerisation domain
MQENISTATQAREPTASPTSAYSELSDLLDGFMTSQAVYVAARLDIAGLLTDAPLTASELAARTDCDAFAVERLMLALTGRGVFARDEAGRFHLNDLATLLRRDAPGSAWPMAIVHGELLYPIWGRLMHTVRTGRRADEVALGADSWRYMQSNAELGSAFHAFMSERATRRAQGLLAGHRFARDALVVDVGGGDGTLLELLLGAYPEMRGVLLEEAAVAESARRRFEAAGLSSRCEVTVGDMFAAVPAGGDVYVLSVVLHDWNDERALVILRRCHEAMRPESRLIIIEIVLPEEPSALHMTDLNLYVGLAGHERTEGDWRGLLERAGFAVTAITPGPRYSYLEARLR